MKGFAGDGQSSEVNSSIELCRLSGELNQRISQEMNGLISSVSMQIQRAINAAIYELMLQIQASLRYINEQPLQRGWNLSAERPARKSESAIKRNIRSSSRDELLET